VARLGRFDQDSTALEERIRSHDRFGSRDLNTWIFGQLAPAPGQRVLDLGCGTGKQSLPLAEAVGLLGRVVCVDISSDALAILGGRADELGVGERVETVNATLDDVPSALEGGRFDRVLGSYSLYYARDPGALLNAIRDLLVPNGILFFCGPGRANNAELQRFHYGLLGEPPPPETHGAVFMEEDGRRTAEELFSSVSVSRFENPLRFDSAEALYRYWSSYNLYDDDLDAVFRVAAAAHFETHDEFVTVKRAVGVHAIR
jgi:SAM-dependent methyltransferase